MDGRKAGFRVRRTEFVECQACSRDHSGLILPARMTLPHLSVSAAMRLPNSPDVIGIGAPPVWASRALILESARPALISVLSLPTISTGVSLGATMPYQVLA